jgi:hypothetical protein
MIDDLLPHLADVHSLDNTVDSANEHDMEDALSNIASGATNLAGAYPLDQPASNSALIS